MQLCGSGSLTRTSGCSRVGPGLRPGRVDAVVWVRVSDPDAWMQLCGPGSLTRTSGCSSVGPGLRQTHGVVALAGELALEPWFRLANKPLARRDVMRLFLSRAEGAYLLALIRRIQKLPQQQSDRLRLLKSGIVTRLGNYPQRCPSDLLAHDFGLGRGNRGIFFSRKHQRRHINRVQRRNRIGPISHP